LTGCSARPAKKHLSPEDHQELTDLLQQLADLDDDGVDDGVDMDLMWALVAKAAKHRLSKADSRREHCSPKTVILGCARNFASV
jgi:hypothetical protein